MLNIDTSRLRTSPYPFLVQQDLLDADTFRALRSSYPVFERSPMWNRMTADLMKGDAGFDAAVSGGAWKQMFDYFHSRCFVDQMLSLYAGTQAAGALRVGMGGLRLTDHVETREWIAEGGVSQRVEAYGGDRSEIFIRMDFGVGESGYARATHVDWRHRICSLMLYFDDADETGMRGGSFRVEEFAGGKSTVRHSFKSRRNLGILKLDDNHSHHSVDEVTRIRGQRRTLYVAVSSRGRVW